MELNIFNQQEEKVAILSTAQNGSHVPIYDANIEEKLDSYDILTFTIDADTEESTYAVEGNTIVFKDIKGWREYYITNVEEEDGDILQKTITAELSLIELADEIIEKDLSGTTTNPKVALASLLEGTRFEVGIVDESIYNKRFNTDTFYLNVLEAISELASEYSAEVQVSYQIKDGKIEKRLINLYKQFGRNNGKRFEIEKDITSIKRTVDISQLKTAIIPFTDEKTSQDEEGNESSGSRITINDVVWSKAKGDPTDKPLGQNYLEDKTALANFGRIGKDGKLKHKKLSMEINVDSAEALISMAWVQLARYSTPKVTYEVKAVDLYELTKDEDFKHEQIFLGDTIIVVDKNFAVPIVIETRVVEVKRDLLDATNNEYVFGTSKELFSYQEQLDSIEEKIKDVVINIDNIQQNADGFTTTYRGSTQPATARENDLWYRPHPTIVGERQMLIFNGTTWEIASDTSVKGLVDKDILEVQNDTQLAIQKAQDAVDLAESVEGSLIFKVGTEEYNAKMTTLEDNINLRVTKGDVVHQINVSDEEILIQGDKIIISGDTTVDGTFKVTNEMIALGVSADKITGGTINGKTINVIDLNADNITGGNLNIQNIKLMNGNQEIVSVTQDGQVNMNVSSLRIGQFNAVTTEELKKLEAQYTFILSNDSATIPTDKDGNNGDYTTATTQPIIYRLGVLDTSNWNITASASTGITGALLNGEYKITKMTADTGKVTFTAKKDNLTLLKVFNISKAKAGITGATGSTGPKGATGSQGPRGLAGLQGPQGEQGIHGTPGANGQSSYTHIAYATGTEGQSFNHDTFSQATHIGMYVSNEIDSSDIPTDYEWTLIKGKDGSQGLRGPEGKNGLTPYFHTAWANSADGISGFDTTVSIDKLYIGTVTTFEPDDPTEPSAYSWTKIKGDKGATGATGPQGATGASGKDGLPGKAGVGISSTVITYATSTSGTTAPTTEWGPEVPSLTKGEYLWTRTIWTYTDNTTEPGYSVSYIAKDGNTGDNGLPGKAGVGISSTKIEYAGSTSGTTKPTSGWGPTVPTVAPGNFLWTKTTWTYTDNTTEPGYSVARMGSNGATGGKGDTGSTGATGASATSYWITASNNIIGKSQTGVINPTTITFKGFSKTGTANPVAYSGRFIIQTSTNGTTYTNSYVSNNINQSSHTYTIPANSLFVKCLFYMAGGTTVLLDEQTVPIVESAEGIQVGGENLLKNSNFKNGLTHWSPWSGASLSINSTGNMVVSYTGSSNNNSGMAQSVNLPVSDYVITAKIKRSTADINTKFQIGTVNNYEPTLPPVNTWGVVTAYLRNTGGAFYIFRNNPGAVGTLEVEWIKVEKGNIPTDWRPHPEDARTYKAWANSSDGTIDFTRTLPNENLFLESYSSYELATYAYMDINPELTDLVGKVYEKDSTVDMTGVFFGFTEVGVDGTIGVNWLMANGILQANASTTGVKSKRRYFSFYPKNEETFDKIKARYSVKLEKGTTPTIYTTNTADSLTGSVMQYVGFSPLDSNNPSEYEWIINPEYTKALSEESLTNKADKGEIDDINNALGDKVDNTTFKGVQEIAEEFAQSYKAFVSDDGKHKKDLEELEKRIELMFLDLGEKVLKLDFVNSYMTAGSEGLLIGSKDSSIKMFLSNSSLTFIDGGNEIAEFNGQYFTIKKGSILEDIQIGEHKVSKFGNGQTVFQWV